MPWWSLKASPPDPSEVRPAVTSPGNQLRPITYRDMAFVRTDDTYWVEGVTMTCFLENGDFVLYSFVVSSIPFNKHKATLNLKINKHDGSPPVYYQQSVTMDRLNFSKDLTSAEFEDGCYFKYDDVHKAFECCTINDNSEKTQELFHGAKFIKIRFVSDVKTGIQLGGRVPEAKEVLENPDQYYQYPPAEHPSNFTFAKEGKFWRQANFPVGSVVISTDTNEVLAKGTGYLGRIATNVALHHFSSSVRHIKVFSEDRRMSLFLVDVQTTEKYAFNKICIAGLQRDGKILMVTQQSEFKHLEEPTVDPITGYKPPRKYMVSFNGPSVDGDSHVHCSLEIAPKKFMERIHVLGHLPGILRWIVEKVVAKPIFYIWNEDPGQVTVNVTVTPNETKTESPAAKTESPAAKKESPAANTDSPATSTPNNVKETPEVEKISFTGPCMHEAHFIVDEKLPGGT